MSCCSLLVALFWTICFLVHFVHPSVEMMSKNSYANNEKLADSPISYISDYEINVREKENSQIQPRYAMIEKQTDKKTRIEFEIEENIASEETSSKKPKRKKPARTRKPKRKRKPCKESEEDDAEDDESEESLESDEKDVATRDPPKSKKPKPNADGSGGKVFFEETFSERSWETAWTYSKMEYGENEKKKFEKFYRVRTRRGRKGYDYGLVTSNKGSDDYAISATFQAINSNDAPLVVQFSIMYQSIPHCEYVYLKLFDCKFKPEELTHDSPFLLQLGPNICARAEKQVLFIIVDTMKGEKYVISDKIEAITSTDTHLYSLTIHPDGNYQILVNDKSMQNGSLTNSFPNYQGFPSICAVGLNIWHSVLDKFFKGQIIVDDILIASDVNYAAAKRLEVLEIMDSYKNSSKM